MKIDRDFARETLVRLIQINSINPSLAPGAPGECEIAAYIAESLREAGLTAGILRSRAWTDQRAGPPGRRRRRTEPDAQRAFGHGGCARDGRAVFRRHPRGQGLRPRLLRHEGQPGGMYDRGQSPRGRRRCA